MNSAMGYTEGSDLHQPKVYKCAFCKKEFEGAWTDEEALTEMKQAFGDVPKEEQEVVCDECYQKMIGEYPPEQYKLDSDVSQSKNTEQINDKKDSNNDNKY